jgi:hypothetical protein
MLVELLGMTREECGAIAYETALLRRWWSMRRAASSPTASDVSSFER